MEQDDANALQAAAKARPTSSCSTNSARSITTQTAIDHSGFTTDNSGLYTQQWYPGHAGLPNGMGPDGMMLQTSAHVQGAPLQGFGADGAMHSPMGHHMSFQHQQIQQQQPGAVRHPLPNEQFMGGPGFPTVNDQMAMMQPNSIRRTTPPNKTSANNEKEMRTLFETNKGRDIADVAKELQENDKGPCSERYRQVFAMLWLNEKCTRGKGSVPRGRVYANYANRCSKEKVTVLNPASFGKLVRILFPGLKTRRLGIRGESKYHYVDFQIDEEPGTVEDDVAADPAPKQSAPAPSKKASGTKRKQSHESLDMNESHPSAEHEERESLRRRISQPRSSWSQCRYIDAHRSDGDGPLNGPFHKVHVDLKIIPEGFNSGTPIDSPLRLPPIRPYLPAGADPDAVQSLVACYTTHLTSSVEAFRFCKNKAFFRALEAFYGTLTSPVQRLFKNPQLAPWISACDLVAYQRMMLIVQKLTLQVVPRAALDILGDMGNRLIPKIRTVHRALPPHVINARELPAAAFVTILERFLRVNVAAHAVARIMTNSANRDLMFDELEAMVNVRRAAECVPARSMDKVRRTLTKDILFLIRPRNIPEGVDAATLQGYEFPVSGEEDQSEAARIAETILTDWVQYLQNLPNKFPQASATDIVLCVERVGNSILRDITMGQGTSFSSWWVLKAWIDETCNFLAESGGYLEMKTVESAEFEEADEMTEGCGDADISREDVSVHIHQTTRSPSPELPSLKVSNMGTIDSGRAPFPPPKTSTFANTNANARVDIQLTQGSDAPNSHDDSGVAMTLPEDQFYMDKLSFSDVVDSSAQAA